MGLPRKSTKKQFLKLMRQSGKSKTNTDSGATDTSKKKISTYEKVLSFTEYVKESNIDGIIIGVDIDGTISNFVDAYNKTYKMYFPDNEVYDADDWYWYQKMDYGDEDANKWFREKKAETFNIAQTYPDAVNTINNLYDFAKNQGYILKIVTNQPNQEARYAAIIWLDEKGFKYDDVVFVDSAKDKWKYCDIMIDDADQVIGNKPLSKVAIKIEQPWNSADADFSIPNIKHLTINLIQRAVDKLK